MDNYLLTFNIISKAQTPNDDGTTRHVILLQSASDELDGIVTLTTDNHDVSAFFVVGGNYPASFTKAV